jgi:hypothetical protein
MLRSMEVIIMVMVSWKPPRKTMKSLNTKKRGKKNNKRRKSGLPKYRSL